MSFGRRQPLVRATRSPALQPAAEPARDENLLHAANAATELVAMLLAAYTFQERLQPESAVAAAGALIGEFALRSTGVPLPEKGAVPGDAANDVLFAGAPEGRPTAWMFMTHGALEAGVAAFDLPKIEMLAARIAATIDDRAVPTLSVPERYVPHEWPLNVGPRFRYRVIATADTHDLSLREVTIALAAASAQLIIRAQHDMPPLIAVTLAAETMLAMARMAPLSEVTTV
jgi:hypothetical protein